jgi:hypothetical protein
VQRDVTRGFLLDADERQVDVRELEAAGERARNALGRGDALVQDGLSERATLFRASAGLREPVGRDEPGRLDQVGNELGELVDGVRRGQATALRSLLRAGPAGCAQFRQVHEYLD